MDIIKPTNGRIVWYTPTNDGDDDAILQLDALQGLTAQICHVHDDFKVNVLITDSEGDTHYRGEILLVQPKGKKPTSGGYVEWMPYQQKQADKHEAEDAEKTKAL